MLNVDGATIEWLGHDSFRICASKVIYIDPFRIEEGKKADIVLITHGHYDHCSLADIRKVSDENTSVVATPDCQSKLSAEKIKLKGVKLVRPGMKLSFEGMLIETVPAYNLNKQFHPKNDELVGYIITIGSLRIYHAGDTDIIPEMSLIKNIDVALLPVSGTYVMTAEEASQAANLINPRIAVPMHYASIVGSRSDAETFKKLCKCKVEILG